MAGSVQLLGCVWCDATDDVAEVKFLTKDGTQRREPVCPTCKATYLRPADQVVARPEPVVVEPDPVVVEPDPVVVEMETAAAAEPKPKRARRRERVAAPAPELLRQPDDLQPLTGAVLFAQLTFGFSLAFVFLGVVRLLA